MCQETAGCKGCTVCGVCGKKPEVAAMQDLLICVTKGLSAVTTAMRRDGKEISRDINHLVTLNLFTTITNANFDRQAIMEAVRRTLAAKEDLLGQLSEDVKADLPQAALWDGGRGSEAEFDARAAAVGVLATKDEDIRSLREPITYGLKGLGGLYQTRQCPAAGLMRDRCLHSVRSLRKRWMTPSPWMTWSPWTTETGNTASTAWPFWTRPIPKPMEIPRSRQ